MVKSIFKSLGLKFFALVAGLYVNYWLNTYLSGSNLASLNYALSLSIVIINFTSFGLSNSIFHYFIESKDLEKRAKFYYTILLIQIGIFVTNFAIITAINYFIFKIDFVILTAIFLTQYVLLSDNVFKSIADATGKPQLFSLSDLASKLFLIFILYLSSTQINDFNSLYIYLGSIVLGSLLQYSIDFYNLKNEFAFKKIRVDVKSLIPYINMFKLLVINSIFVAMFQYTDKFYIKFLITDNNELNINGYNNIYKLYELCYTVSLVFLPVFYKKLTDELKSKSLENIHSPFDIIKNKVTIISLFTTLIISIGFYIVAPLLLNIIDKDNKYTYYSMINLIPLTLAIIPYSLQYFIDQTYTRLQIFRRELISLVLTAVVVNICYFILIKYLGIIGASLSSMICAYFVVIIKYCLLPKQINLKKFD